MIGKHISVTNPLCNMNIHARREELETYQFFNRNNRNGRMRQMSYYDYTSFNETVFSKAVVIHASYIMNPASPDSEKRNKAISIISDDMHFAKSLNVPIKYVLHPGSHMGSGVANGTKRLVDILHSVEIPSNVDICVETMSGAGTEIMSSVQNWLDVMSDCKDINIKMTFDTCHVFASGFDIESTYDMFKKFIGVVHMNDSQYPFGSRKDRHTSIGQGYIGNELLYSVFTQVDENIPIILETPTETIDADYEILKKWKVDSEKNI